MLRIFALVLTMLLCGGLARSTEGTWSAPSVFFCLIWGFYVLTASYFFIDPQLMLGGILWITLACGTIYLGTLFARLHGPKFGTVRVGPAEVSALPLLRPVLLATLFIGALQILFLLARQGYSVRSLLSFAALGQLTAANRGEFTYGDQQQTVGEQLGFLGLYFGALGGGLLFKLAATKRERVIGALNLLMPAVVLALYGSRMGVLYGGGFWVSSYVAAHVLQQGSGRSDDARFLLRIGALAVAVLLGLQVAVQVVRYSTESKAVPLFRMIADPFGFVAAFSLWLHHIGWHFSQFTMGARTFRKLASVVGVSAPLVPSIDVGFTSSNIYTVFRDLIDDFGTVGALLVLGVYGYCARHIFVRVRAGNDRLLGVLTLIFAFALTSFTEGVFYYTSTTLAALGFAMYCWLFGGLPRATEHGDPAGGRAEPPRLSGKES